MLYFVFAFFLSLISARNEYIATSKFHNGVNLHQDCDLYEDCYNCTLAKCRWTGI